MSALRLMVYDRTCARRGVGLSTAWRSGASLYRGLGRLDATFGASSWGEALVWLATHAPSRQIAEIQYWGHGQWGRVLVDRDALDASRLDARHPDFAAIEAVRDRLLPDGASLVWFRTCEAFGARSGHDFAARLADTFRARVAGHTFVIGAIQTGLRALKPGTRPGWSATEGIREGTPDAPRRAWGSRVLGPRTISCLSPAFPSAWFDEDSA